jgi:nicotinamidase/pyrazinamidase
MIDIKPNDALVIIDPQIDFCPGGALAVTGGDEIMKGINVLAMQFHLQGGLVVLTQDWHPSGHKSFASSHGRDPFSSIELPYGDQTLWPDHCVQGSAGAEFHPHINGAIEIANVIVRKGMNPEVDSYSAFFENNKTTATGLGGYLREKGVERVVLVGLAYDFCVAYSALDARRLGFDALVIKDLTRSIAMPVGDESTVEVMERLFAENDVEVI